MSFAIVTDIIATVAITALLADSYGFVRRRSIGSVLAPYLMGVIFGLMALVQMFNPLEPFEGVIVDLSNIPIALAGAFLGVRGLLPCLAIAMFTRISLGGVGVESAMLGMTLAGGAGLVWSWKLFNLDARGFKGFVLLGFVMSIHLLGAAILPSDIAIWFYTSAALPMLGLNVIAVPLLAAMLERENHRIRRDNRFVASATHDPVSGLLLPLAFMRKMANAYTAGALGTFAGFLTITPERGIWRTAAGLFGEPAPIALDRQALANHFEHAELAGLCEDGRILVPLSADEVAHESRVKASLNLAMRDTPSAAAGTVVTLSVVEVPDPAEFLHITKSVVVPAFFDWKGETEARQKSAPRPEEEPRVRSCNLYNRHEHEILFSKAEFLIGRKDKYAP